MNKTVFEGLSAPATEYINVLENKVDEMQNQIDQLTELLIKMNKDKFGSSSEKVKYILSDEFLQESLFNEAEAYADENAPEPVIIEKHTRKPKRTKEELAKDLPVKETIVDIPENERLCNICESDLYRIGKEFVRRELCIIPAQAYVEEIYRVTYGCNPCANETEHSNIIKADVPVPVVKRGLASPSSAAYVMYQKYVNAMPLYRQEQDFKTFGVKISRATLANWIIYTSKYWLEPLWKALKALLLEASVILADETVVQVLKEPGKTAQSDSRMWVYCTGNVESPPPIVLFEYQPTRCGVHPKEFLKSIENPFYLLTDGYKGYNAVTNANHAGCWAHTRRKFEEAMPKNAPKDNKARIGLEYCQKLFMLERKFKDMKPEERLKERRKQSKPVYDEFYEWLGTLNPLAGANLSKAITYAVNQKEHLSTFLQNGCVEISTNRVENNIRPFTTGRKNWLFSDTVNGAKASAVAYSVISTAVANGLNPFQYLQHLFTHLPTVLTKDPDADLSHFFPWAVDIQEKCKFAQGAQGQLSLLT
jgi:transposase